MRFLYQQVSYNKPRRKNAKVGKLQSCRYLDNGVSYKGEMDNRILPFKELHQIKYLSKSDSFTIRSPSQGSCEGLFILYKACALLRGTFSWDYGRLSFSGIG
jgi:hypothetical protein